MFQVESRQTVTRAVADMHGTEFAVLFMACEAFLGRNAGQEAL